MISTGTRQLLYDFVFLLFSVFPKISQENPLIDGNIALLQKTSYKKTVVQILQHDNLQNESFEYILNSKIFKDFQLAI